MGKLALWSWVGALEEFPCLYGMRKFLGTPLPFWQRGVVSTPKLGLYCHERELDAQHGWRARGS